MSVEKKPGRLKAEIKKAIENNYIANSAEADYQINLYGKYDYMESAYFYSQDVEAAGLEIHPSCKEMLDAYITPIMLEKARTGGIPIPAYFISNGYFEPPVIIDPINPFMIKSRTVLRSNNTDKIARSMTRNYTYAICCQELPAEAKVKKFRMILGWSTAKAYRELAMMVWDTFKLPLATIRVIVLKTGMILISDISHLPYDDLNDKEMAYLAGKIRWEK